MVEEALYRKTYKIRQISEKMPVYELTLPRIIVEREARKHGLSVEAFLKQFVAVAQFNSIEGVHYTFERKKRRQDED